MGNARIGRFKRLWSPGDRLSAHWHNIVSNFVANFRVSGPGLSYSFDGKTPMISLVPPDAMCPYKLAIVDNSGTDGATVAYGTLEGETHTFASADSGSDFGGVPTIGGTEIGTSPAPELSLTANKTNVVLLKVTTAPDETIKNAVIQANASDALPANVPADFVGDTDGTYYLEIGRVDVDASGVASNARNAWCGSVQFKGCGDGNVEWSILISGAVSQSLASSGA